MKKIVMILAAVAMVAVSANAQDEKWYGAKEGGFAISFNANPVLNYVGNMFNGTQNNRLEGFDGIDGNNVFGGATITGKYFLKDNMAVDFGFGFNNNYNVTNNYDDASDLEEMTSFDRNAATQFQLKAGLEYRLRPGKRLQPIFGGDLIYAHTNRWTYNEVTSGNNEDDYTYYGAPTNALGLMLNAGVEYFVTPQISLGANLDFAVTKVWRGRSVDVDPDDTDPKTSFSRISSSDTFLRTNNYGANVSLNFYF